MLFYNIIIHFTTLIAHLILTLFFFFAYVILKLPLLKFYSLDNFSFL